MAVAPVSRGQRGPWFAAWGQVKALVAGQLQELRQQGGEVLRALRGLEAQGGPRRGLVVCHWETEWRGAQPSWDLCL